MPPRGSKAAGTEPPTDTATDEPSAVSEPGPGELNESIEKLGEAVTTNDQNQQGTADAEGQHGAAIDQMFDAADQLQLDTGELVYDVRDFLLEQIKQRPKPWSATSQAEQRDVAAACEHSAQELVRKIVEAVAARGQDPVRVLLTKVTLGNDMVIAGKVKTFDSAEEDRAVETLHKAIGKHVLLTVASADDYKGDGRDPETDPDEPPLDFEAGSEDDDAE